MTTTKDNYEIENGTPLTISYTASVETVGGSKLLYRTKAELYPSYV